MKSLLLGRGSLAAIVFGFFLCLGLLEDYLLNAVGSEAQETVRIILHYGVRIGTWLSGAALFIRILNALFWDRAVARATGRPVPHLLKDFAGAIIYLVAVAGIVGVVFNQSIVGIWATSSAVGVVLGFALRSMIADVFTGLALNVDRSFSVGDWVEFRYRDTGDRTLGKIRDIGWRTTILELESGSCAVVPNSMVGTVAITNHSAPNPVCRHELTITLDFSVSPQRALRVLEAAAKAAAGQNGIEEKPEPHVLIKEISSLGTVYLVRYFADLRKTSPTRARHFVHRAVLDHLHQTGITPAYPKQDQFNAEMPARHLELRSQTDRASMLRKIDLLESSLSAEELTQLAAASRQRDFAQGEALIRQGEEDHSMFILAEGLVEVFVSVDGKPEVRVARLGPGEFFGEMALLTGERRSATIVAATDTVAFEVTKAHMRDLFRSRPEIADTLSVMIAERRINTTKALATATVEEKAEASRTLSEQILTRIKQFFHFAPAEGLRVVTP